MNRKLLIIGSAIGLLLIIIIISQSVQRAATFNLTSTNPKDGGTPNQYAPLVFNFNRSLADIKPGVNQVTVTPSIAGTTVVSDKTVTFTPNLSYDTSTDYKATLSGILDKQGEKLADITISFSPKNVAYADLPKDIQQRLTKDTTDRPAPYSPDTIAIGGSATLIDQGLMDDQLYGFKTDLFNFFKSQNNPVRALDLVNVNKAPHVFGTFNDSFVFDIAINGIATYRARLDYSDTSTTRLILNDSKTGKQLYDSQTAPQAPAE